MHLTSLLEYLLRTNTSNEDLAKKFERTVLTCVGRDSSEIAVCQRRFFVRKRLLASENGLYELASIFCHVSAGRIVASLDKTLYDDNLCMVALSKFTWEEIQRQSKSLEYDQLRSG